MKSSKADPIKDKSLVSCEPANETLARPASTPGIARVLDLGERREPRVIEAPLAIGTTDENWSFARIRAIRNLRCVCASRTLGYLPARFAFRHFGTNDGRPLSQTCVPTALALLRSDDATSVIALAVADLTPERPVHERRIAEDMGNRRSCPNEHEHLRAWRRGSLPDGERVRAPDTARSR